MTLLLMGGILYAGNNDNEHPQEQQENNQELKAVQELAKKVDKLKKEMEFLRQQQSATPQQASPTSSTNQENMLNQSWNQLSTCSKTILTYAVGSCWGWRQSKKKNS